MHSLYICTASMNSLFHENIYSQQYKYNIIIYIRILNISYELIYIFISFKYNIYIFIISKKYIKVN